MKYRQFKIYCKIYAIFFYKNHDKLYRIKNHNLKINQDLHILNSGLYKILSTIGVNAA